jgi:pimeloyl-ACP methyl ester carboxylesterase
VTAAAASAAPSQVPATETPASAAPATQAPPTDAPATAAPATQAPASGVPASAAPTDPQPAAGSGADVLIPIVAALALVGVSVPMPVGEAFLAAARDDDPAAFDMEATWGLARHSQLATSPAPGLVLHGANRRLLDRAAAGVQYADLSACHAYAPSPGAIRAIAAPTLVIAGRRDVMTPPKPAQALAREVPGARFELLDTGHCMPGEAPREVTRLLQAHFAGADRSAAG